MTFPYYTVRAIMQLAAKKGVKRSTFPKNGLKWRGKVKDYPGAKAILKQNRQTIAKKAAKHAWETTRKIYPYIV
jgi:predicted transposase YbfD/YdcC